MGGEEIDRIKERLNDSRKRLRVLDRQIAQFGEKWAPAHLITESAEIREAISKYETVLGSPLSAEVGDELGDGGRFILYVEELRAVKDSVALYGYQLGEFIQSTNDYRAAHEKVHGHDRRWQIAAAVGVFLILAFVLGRLI